MVDLPLLRTLLAIRQKSWETSLWEVMESFVLLACASWAASRTLLQWLLGCLKFTLEAQTRRYKQKKWFLWAMVAAQVAENHEDEWGLTWYFLWGIYTSIPTWNHSQNSLAAAEALSLKISSNGISLKWSRRPSQSAYVMKWGITLRLWWKANGNWENNMIRISKRSESHCRTNNSIRRNKLIQNSRTDRITVWDTRRKFNHLSKVVWDNRVHYIHQLHQNRLASPYDGR